MFLYLLGLFLYVIISIIICGSFHYDVHYKSIISVIYLVTSLIYIATAIAIVWIKRFIKSKLTTIFPIIPSLLLFCFWTIGFLSFGQVTSSNEREYLSLGVPHGISCLILFIIIVINKIKLKPAIKHT